VFEIEELSTMEIPVEHAIKDFQSVLEHVVNDNGPVIVVGPKGRLVRISPIPKPLYYFKGHPVYRSEDLQYLGIPPYE
jgi:hypothetical protein